MPNNLAYKDSPFELQNLKEFEFVYKRPNSDNVVAGPGPTNQSFFKSFRYIILALVVILISLLLFKPKNGKSKKK